MSDSAAPARVRAYARPDGHDEVLLDADSLNHMAPLAQLVLACALPIHAVLDSKVWRRLMSTPSLPEEKS